MTVARTLTLAATCALAGCGAIMHGPRQAVPVNSTPTGATVTVSPATESPVTTPGTLDLERKQSYMLNFTSPGYSSATVALHPHIGGGTLVADILLGLVGVIVDAATGSWYGLVPENVNVTLTRTTGMGPEKIEVHVGQTSDGKVEISTDGPPVQVQVVPVR